MLKSYLKTYNLFSFITIIIFIGAILFFYFVRHERFLACFCVAFAIVETVKSYSKFKKKQSYLDELRENGLTEKTVNDADFVERWAKTREKGVYKFYVFNGGILLAVPIEGILLMIGDVLWAIPPVGYVDFSQYALVTCVFSVIASFVANRFLWRVNEMKFARLIGSLH